MLFSVNHLILDILILKLKQIQISFKSKILLLFLYKLFNIKTRKTCSLDTVHLAGAVEYVNCISTKG